MTEKTAASALHPEVNELIARLRSARDARSAAECCEALAAHIESAETKLESSRIEEAAHRVSAHPQDSDLLLGVGRLYLAADLLDPAYRSLSEAVRLGAGRRGYRLLGETLLRLGDAQIAKPMLKRAISAGCSDPETRHWYDTAKAYIPMQEAKGIAAVAAAVERGRAERAAAPRVPPPKPPPPKRGASAQPASKRPGASGAWRLGWLGSRVAGSDRPPPVTITPAARDLERSLPRFEIPGIPGSGRRAPPPVVPGARKPPKPPPPAAQTRTRTDAPVTVDLGSDDEVDFDLDRDGHDVEVIAEKTGPLATLLIPPPPPSPKVASPSPPAVKADAAVSADVKPAPATPGAPKLVDERLWHSELNIRLPPPPPRPRRARQIALGAALVVLGIGAGFFLGRFSDRVWARPVAAASSPESERGACVTARATATAAPKAAAPPATQAPAATTEAASAKELAPPSSNARTVQSAKPLPPSKAMLALTGAPATQGLAGVAMATAADALLARARPARFAAPVPSARPRAPAAAPAPAPATKRR